MNRTETCTRSYTPFLCGLPRLKFVDFKGLPAHSTELGAQHVEALMQAIDGRMPNRAPAPRTRPGSAIRRDEQRHLLILLRSKGPLNGLTAVYRQPCVRATES
jgi:hypothetical protein